jgi:hypothetical protein
MVAIGMMKIRVHEFVEENRAATPGLDGSREGAELGKRTSQAPLPYQALGL